jgi:cell division protein FtsL
MADAGQPQAPRSSPSREPPRRRRAPFLVLWTLAVAAVTAAFTVQLAIRVRAVDLGYELGRAHAHVERLREVRRVLELEVASHKAPERVGFVARQLLGMGEPTADRIFSAGAMPTVEDAEAESAGSTAHEAENVAQGTP